MFSDQYEVGAGYEANVDCVSNLNSKSFLPNIDFTYYPNPSKGFVAITSKTEIKEIFVYNPQGRLLYQKAVNSLDTKVDMASFANGTYFFKLKFNEKEANFKIVKL
ncbi:T9SS type A sorting domain-containing protein [Flavobacterium myungsuense]|uniref:T9SS type A sorting domain-containing protein n=1 Tax=Flavobacterium myungsuense TaxID=651823 RepID=UPI00363EB763